MPNEFVFQSEQFIETGLKSGANTVMRIFANGTIELGEINEVALTSSLRLFSNSAVQAAEFIEVPPN